jgi:hypothetical protein
MLGAGAAIKRLRIRSIYGPFLRSCDVHEPVAAL